MAHAQVMMPHRGGCPENLRDLDSGFADDGVAFIVRYEIAIGFPIGCLGCCLNYLETERQYEGIDGYYNCVYFARRNDRRMADVACFVRVPIAHNGMFGQIATHEDINLGIPMKKVVSNSRTYQLYNQVGGLSVGVVGTYRMESVAIDRVRPEELVSIYVNYADATLLELYRGQRNRASLQGVCALRPFDRMNIAGLILQNN